MSKSSEETNNAVAADNQTDADKEVTKARSWLSLINASNAGLAISVVVAITGYFYFRLAYDQTARENTRSEITQLRNIYARIDVLASHPSDGTGLGGLELDTDLSIAADTLARLGKHAKGADYEFIGDAYRHASHPDLAVPMYEEALRRTTQAYGRIVILRGLAYARVLLGDLSDARRDLRMALYENRATPTSPAVRGKNDANTQRVWVTVEFTAGKCRMAAIHFDVYKRLNGKLPVGLRESTSRLRAAQSQVARCLAR